MGDMQSNFFEDVFPCAFGGKIVVPFDERRLVEKSSFQGGKRDFCVDLGLIVLADCHISEGENAAEISRRHFLEER